MTDEEMQEAMSDAIDRLYGCADNADWNGIASILDAVAFDGMGPMLAYCYLAYTYQFSGITVIAAARDRYAERLHVYLVGIIGRKRAVELMHDYRNMPAAEPAPKKVEFDIRQPFVSATWRDILRSIASDPPSDGMMAASLVAEVRAIVARLDAMSDADVWNEYKRLLDQVVRYASAAPAIQTLLDLGPHYVQPVGGYAHADGSINDAPWRREGT